MSKNKVVRVSSLTEWKLIDRGHFGSVYKAKSKDFKEHVAVKKLNRDELQGIKELLSEAEKMASASASPYVIRLFGIMEEENSLELGIVMEYMEYGSLWTLMERVKTIPWALKFRIIHEVTLGMNWLHNLAPPLLHLDLKTKNVLLNEGLHIKITDFGLSKFTSSSSSQGTENCEGIGGTLEYMPPEAFQEGYQPSTSTDVYSFAILSAVVLRGESPYPVDKSAVIRLLVPRGQRPCLKSLENETSMKDLSQAIEFTKCCWDNDRLKRPPFSDCCNIWEEIFTAYKCDIKQAVRQIQDEIDTSASCGNTTDVSHSGQTVSVNTKDISGIFQKFHTMNISEEPDVPVLVESVPTNMQNTSTSVRPKSLSQGDPRLAMVSNSRPQSANYAGSVPVTPSQHTRVHPETPRYLPGTMVCQPNPCHRMLESSPKSVGSYYRPLHQSGQGYSQVWNPLFPKYLYPTPNPYSNIRQPLQSKGTTINVSGCSNFQIGDNSFMNVTDNFRPGPYRNSQQPILVYPRGSQYVPPIRAQPAQTTQGYNNMPGKKTSSDQPSKQETVKRNPQSQLPPVRTTPVGHSSNACTIQATAGSVCPTEEPTTRTHPGQ